MSTLNTPNTFAPIRQPAAQARPASTPLSSQDPRILLADERELKKGRIGASLWGSAFGPLALVARWFLQNPAELAAKRQDVMTGQRSYEDALAHEKDMKHAQIIAGILPAFTFLGAGVLQIIGIALLDNPEKEVAKKHPELSMIA